MRCTFFMIGITECPPNKSSPKHTLFYQILNNMGMSNNPVKHEVLTKQYLRSILDINVFLGKILYSHSASLHPEV